MSVILGPCAFKLTDLAQFLTVNISSKPLNKEKFYDQEVVWAKITDVVANALKTEKSPLRPLEFREPTLFIYHGHTREVKAVTWSPDGQRIASGGDDQTVQVWDATGGKRFYTYSSDYPGVNSVAWSPDGRRIASGGEGGIVQVWDTAIGGLLFTYQGHSDRIYAVMWSPDSSLIASGSRDATVQVWEVK